MTEANTATYDHEATTTGMIVNTGEAGSGSPKPSPDRAHNPLDSARPSDISLFPNPPAETQVHGRAGNAGHDLPMSVDLALKIIRETSADSSKVGIPQDLGFDRTLQDWQHIVTHRQIQRRLEDGTLVGKPKLDASGNWKCQMERFGSGALVRITVVAECNEHKDWRLYVTDWSKTDGP